MSWTYTINTPSLPPLYHPPTPILVNCFTMAPVTNNSSSSPKSTSFKSHIRKHSSRAHLEPLWRSAWITVKPIPSPSIYLDIAFQIWITPHHPHMLKLKPLSQLYPTVPTLHQFHWPLPWFPSLSSPLMCTFSCDILRRKLLSCMLP